MGREIKGPVLEENVAHGVEIEDPFASLETPTPITIVVEPSY